VLISKYIWIYYIPVNKIYQQGYTKCKMEGIILNLS